MCLLLRFVVFGLVPILASCAPTKHRFHDASFTLPWTWSETRSPVPSSFAAVDATRDGYDLFMVVHRPHSGDPAAMPSAVFKQVASDTADKTIQIMRKKQGFLEVSERSRGTAKIDGVPTMEQVVAARMSWPDGQSGDVVMSSRVFAKKGGIYNFTLRESGESHRKDPGYFKRLVDTVRFE
jgi:hypothetical protein